MSTAVVYYSKNNNTRVGAENLGERLGAKVIELKEAKNGNVFQAIRKKGSTLEEEPWNKIKNDNEIFIMTPIWASNSSPAINAFLNNADLSNKEVTIITFQQSRELKGSEKVHNYIKKKVEQKNGKVLNCYALVGAKMGHFAGEDSIKSEIDKIFK